MWKYSFIFPTCAKVKYRNGEYSAGGLRKDQRIDCTAVRFTW